MLQPLVIMLQEYCRYTLVWEDNFWYSGMTTVSKGTVDVGGQSTSVCCNMTM